MAARKRILIVDDDPGACELLLSALEDGDRELEAVRDGLAALSRVLDAEWDLVITDVMMPGMGGMELLERLRAVRPGMPVIVMTVSSTPEGIAGAIRERAFAWVNKPIRMDALRDIVETALRGGGADDDIEVMSVSPVWLGLRLRCKMSTATRILQFMREMHPVLPEAEQEKVATAFREILLNAIEHGGGNNPEKKVTITYVKTARALLYYVRDPGPGFSMSALPHAAVSNPAEAPFEHSELRQRLGMRPGGFGILMTRSLVDELIYNEKGNEVLLIKYLPAEGGGGSSEP